MRSAAPSEAARDRDARRENRDRGSATDRPAADPGRTSRRRCGRAPCRTRRGSRRRTGWPRRACTVSGWARRACRADGHDVRRLQVLRLEDVIEIERVADFLAVAVIAAIRPASPFIASSVWSYDIVFDGNAHMFPIVIEPNPRAVLPFARRDPAMDVEQRDAIDDAPAELVGRAIDVVLVAVADLVDPDVGRRGRRSRPAAPSGAARGRRESRGARSSLDVGLGQARLDEGEVLRRRRDRVRLRRPRACRPESRIRGAARPVHGSWPWPAARSRPSS